MKYCNSGATGYDLTSRANRCRDLYLIRRRLFNSRAVQSRQENATTVISVISHATNYSG